MTSQPCFNFASAAYDSPSTTSNRALDDTFRAFHFELCRALDMTRMSIALAKMVEAGWLDKRMAELFHQQASTLLALMVSENNRIFSSRIDAHDRG